MPRLILATRNAHKTREFIDILGPGFVVSDLSDVRGIPLVEETGRTFEENAILKAVAASSALPDWVVADDSGLEVEVLNGAPGVRSARFAGEDARDSDNVAKLLSEVGKADPLARNRRARFCCALALARAGKLVHTVRGTIEGTLTVSARGEGGFGYDPLFVPAGRTETFAELGAKTKNLTSHRARAIAELRTYLGRVVVI